MNFHVIRVHCSNEKYFYMLLLSHLLFNIDYFLQAVSLRQFVDTGFFRRQFVANGCISLWLILFRISL